MKRVFDFIISLFGLIILSPLLLIIGCIIKLRYKGPILFKQYRVGRGGKLFVLYKFRSMHVSESTKNGIFEPGNITRITSFGKFLRKSKLDELPQLFNVMIGDMSMVGPRPEVEKWVVAYAERWKRILTVRPGITDNASILLRNEESILKNCEDPEKLYRETIIPKKLDLYEEYVLNKSFCKDFILILKTLYILILKK